MVFLALCGAIAGAVNTVAGGGSLLSFPGLMWAGLPSLQANATNSIALWPGSLAGAIGLMNKLRARKRTLAILLVPTFVGSLAGAWLLVRTGEELFRLLVPGLILLATVLLMLQKRIRAWVLGSGFRVNMLVSVVLQFLVSVYGGYFGAGMGILMLASLGLALEGDIHELNAFKNWLGLLINLVASIFLLGEGLVDLQAGGAMMLGAIVGGYLAGKYSQKVDPERLRFGIVIYGFVMTAWFVLAK